MKIEKHFPSAELSRIVKQYLIIETDTERINNTLPGTSLVLSFRFNGSVFRITGQGRDPMAPWTVAGLRRSNRQFLYEKGTSNFLIIFKEGAFSYLSKTPSHELFDLQVTADNFFSRAELEEISEKLSATQSTKARVALIEAFLMEKINSRKPDELVSHAVDTIQQHKGLIKIRALAETLNVSQDPFEKRFRRVIGSSPKQYASIVRFNHVIERYPSYQSLTDASLDAGYYDQAHFIKDFRRFTGEAPGAFLKRPNRW